MTLGLPGSGKTTWASKQKGCLIVNRDTIRIMLHGGQYVFDPKIEGLVKDISFYAVNDIIEFGHDLIIDECNIKISLRSQWMANIISSFHKRSDVKIIYVWFTEDKNNVKNRMRESRGISREKWAEICKNMKDNFEYPVKKREGFDELIKINIGDK